MRPNDEDPLDGYDDETGKPNPEHDSSINPDHLQEKHENKLSPDEIVDRTIEIFDLFKQTDDLAKRDQERREKINKEVIELQSGELRTIESYTVTDFVQPYIALFGKDVPFFKEMFRVADIDHKHNPDSFSKPSIAGILVNEFIYRRFGKTVIAILRAKAIPNGDRRYKFSQFLDQDSKQKIRQFRDDAIAMMKKYRRGQLYEMRIEYARVYNVEGFQYRLDV